MKRFVTHHFCNVLMLSVSGLMAGCCSTCQKSGGTEPTATKDAMTVTELKKEIIKAAPEGAVSPQKGQTVTVHYTGWLYENGNKGKMFNTSFNHGGPFTFVIGDGKVIPGWDKGVMDMKVGEKALLTIPPHLGYGARGAGRVIPPNATLIFEVELMEVR